MRHCVYVYVTLCIYQKSVSNLRVCVCVRVHACFQILNLNTMIPSKLMSSGLNMFSQKNQRGGRGTPLKEKNWEP